MPSRWDKIALQGKRVYWLLDIEYAGQTHRISTADINVSSDDGDLHYSDGVLDISSTETLDLLSTAVSPSSIALEVVLPVDVAKLVAQGHDLAGATGELSQWVEGSTYEERVTRLIGRISDPEYGDDELPVRFSLEDNYFDDTSQIPPEEAKISSKTTDTAYVDSSDLELPYPIVFGHPGQIDSTEKVTGSTALWRYKATYHHQVVLAGHRIQCEYVYLNNDDDTTALLFQVNHITDGMGREIAVILEANDQGSANTPVSGTLFYYGLDSTGVPASFQPAVAESVPLFVSWKDPDDITLGGVQGEGGNLIRGAGDVIEYILRQSNMRVDYGKIKAVKSRLNGFNIDTAIDARTKPWEYVQQNLLPLLPVTVASGPEGIYLVYYDYMATPADAVATLDADADPGIVYGDYISYDSSEVANQFSISYAYSARTGAYIRTLVMGAAGPLAYANGDIICYGNDKIRIWATSPGGTGDGIEVTVTETGALAVSESASTKTVTLEFQNAVTTVTAMVDAVNNNLTTVRASLISGTGATVMGAGDLGTSVTGVEQVVNLQLRGSFSGTPSYMCQVSQSRYKNRLNATGIIEKSIETRAVYEPATAAMIASWWAKAYCFARRRIDALLPEADWAWLEIGNIVLVTTSRLYLSNQVAIVEEVERGDDGHVAVRLLFIEDPPRDDRGA